MKLKQIKLYLFALLAAFTLASGFVAAGVGVRTQTAQAYVCPGTGPSGEPLYDYHESDGKCWKRDYKPVSANTSYPTVTNGSYGCANGASIKSVSGKDECQVTCAAGDPYHADTNTCYHYTFGQYVSQETQGVSPTLNDGRALPSDQVSCSDGFTYISQGKTPGCYKLQNGRAVCGPDQTYSVGSRTGTITCDDTGKNHLIPKDTNQSSDGSDCQAGLTKDNNACKPYSDFTNKDACTAHGGDFTLTKRDPTNASNDVWTCVAPADPCAQYTGDKKKGCQAGQNGEDCTKQQSDSAKAACDKAKQAAGLKSDFGTSKCDGIATNLVASCDGTGVSVIAGILKVFITVLSALIGVAAVGGIAWSAMQYASAQDNQGNVTAARERIRNIIIGLLLYGFMIAIINWLVPGGVIG